MITNRRTSFTNLEYPNPFEDPTWSSWDAIPNKNQVAQATAGQKVTYTVPDGASGWYAMRVIADGLGDNENRFGSWQYTYLHEGSSVELWCNSGSTGSGRKSLGADGSSGIGGAAGILCGFKRLEAINRANYGIYPTATPIRVVSGSTVFSPWEITFSNGRKITRYTLGTENWDATSSKNSPLFILIDGKPCLSFENPSSIMAATGVTKVKGEAETFDGIYLGTTPIEMNKSVFTAAAGLIVGQPGSSNGTGGGALGSSSTRDGATGSFGAAPSDTRNPGSAFFDFTRNITASKGDTGSYRFNTTDVAGATLYKINIAREDPLSYGQIFTAPASEVDVTFHFYVNGTEYQFPSTWVEPNVQKANSGEYQTFIQGIHIGDALEVSAEYADDTVSGAYYLITMHDIVYGLYFAGGGILFNHTGDYSLRMTPGKWYIWAHGSGGAGGTGGTQGNVGAGGSGGAGGKGDLVTKSIDLEETVVASVTVGSVGLTFANGGNGGSHGYSNGNSGNGGDGGGGGHPSYVVINDVYAVYASGGGGGGTNVQARYNGGAGGGGGGGYYRRTITNALTAAEANAIISVPGKNGVNGVGGMDPASGITGNTTDFPNIRAGRSRCGRDWENQWREYYSDYRYGGGASGGGGGGANWNTDYSTAGGGGGGAGGSPSASGGDGGKGWLPGEAGSNYHTTPRSTINHLGQTVTNGWGTGGAPGQNGTEGWVYLEKADPITEYLDFGYLMTTEPSSSDDAGSITGNVSETDDAGTITGTVSSSDDAGLILGPTDVDSVWNMGSVTDSVTEKKNFGNVIS